MNVQQLERQYEDARQHAASQRSRFTDAAARDGRELGAGEVNAINSAVLAANALKDRLDRARSDQRMTSQIDSLTSPMRVASSTIRGGSLGAQIVASDMYRWLRETRKTRAGVWTSPASELFGVNISGAAITGDPASGGDLVIPDFRPGIVSTPLRPTRIADLLAPGTTDSNTVTYMEEVAYAIAAAAVAEGGLKPESTLVFDAKSEPVRKIAHWIPVSEEMLDDVGQLQSYLDVRLRAGVDVTVDDQLLNGDGTAPNLSGILDRVGLGAPIARVDPQTNADVIAAQISALETATSVPATGIVLHPAQWASILLTKDTTGQYIGAGPFASPGTPTLWGLPVAVTSVIAAGTALVGAFRTAAQMFDHGQLRVEASNSHADFFIRNLVAIRAERRLALAVYRPAAFGLCTGLS